MSLASRKPATWLFSLGYWHAPGHSRVMQLKTARMWWNVHLKVGDGVFSNVERMTHVKRFRRGWVFSVTLPRRVAFKINHGRFATRPAEPLR